MARAYIGEGVKFLGHGHGDPVAQVRESNLNELLWIDRAVEVATFTDSAGELDAGSVSGLPKVEAVHAARHFTDEHWG